MNKKLLLILLALSLTAAVFVVGCSSDDNNEPTVTAPAAPTNVVVTQTAPTVAQITWTAAVLDDAPDGYKVERRIGTDGTWTELASVGTSVVSFTDTTLELGSGNAYYFHVGAYNTGGTTYSATTPAVTVKTFQQLLLGAWDATNCLTTIFTDSSSFTFEYTNNLYKYTRVDYYEGLDSDQWDSGTYTTNGTEIVFTVQLEDGVEIDSTYTWAYEPNKDGETMTVDHDYGEGPITVDYELVTVPVF